MSDLTGLVTMEISFYSLVQFAHKKPLCALEMNDKQVSYVFLSLGHLGNSLILAFYGLPYCVQIKNMQHTNTHTDFCLEANVLFSSDKFAKMTVFVSFSFGMCCDGLHK